MNFLAVWIFVLFAAVQLVWIRGNPKNGRTILKHSNKMRYLHRCPPLLLDPNLSIDCENYAKHLAKTKNFSYSDPTNKEYTENICKFEIRAKDPFSRCVKNWYSGTRFDLLDPRANEFTAMIWRSSKNMGYGDAPLKLQGYTNFGLPNSLEAIMVVRYTPPGNVPGLYSDNVPPRAKREKEDKKKKKKKRRSCAIRNANLASLKLFTILICLLLISPFINSYSVI